MTLSDGLAPASLTSHQWLIWRYYAYRCAVNNGFFLAVGILYIQDRGLGLDVVGFTQAAFFVAILALQIPSGYVGDRIGHRNALVLGSIAVTLVMLLYPLGSSLLTFALLYVLWGFGWAFDTGAREAWLYEILDERSDAGQFARISGRGEMFNMLGSALTAGVAGVLFTVDPALPFLANAALTALAVPILLSLPADSPGAAESRFSVRDATRVLSMQVQRADVRWFVLYIALFYALFDVTRAYEQPAATEVGVSVVALGVLYSGFKLVSAAASSLAGPLYERFGVRSVFVLLLPVTGVSYSLILVRPELVILVFFVARSLRAVTAPIQNQYFNDRLGDAGRATVLSGISMTLSAAGVGAHVFGALLSPRLGSVALIMTAGTGLVVVATIVWVTTAPVRRDQRKEKKVRPSI